MPWKAIDDKIYYGKKDKDNDVWIDAPPDQFHNWNGSEWVLDAERKTLYNRLIAKELRQKLVDSIIVTVNGKQFDGDEISQTRMTRVIVGLQATGQNNIMWTFADNSVGLVSLPELIEALCLAGQRQCELWALST